MTHDLKTWDTYFEKVWSGEKRFEVRKNDRGFNVWDVLTLMEYSPKTDQFSDRWIQVKIDYILEGGSFGIESDHIVMSITPISKYSQKSGIIKL